MMELPSDYVARYVQKMRVAHVARDIERERYSYGDRDI